MTIGIDGKVLPDAGVDLPAKPEHQPYPAHLQRRFDLGTTYFGVTYERKHLPIPDALQKNINYKFFPTGHMVYVNEDALRGLYDTVAGFIHSSEKGQ